MSHKKEHPGLPLPSNALRTNLEGVYALPPPPEGFRPLTADNRVLQMYGLPLRPDAKRNPQALRAWTRAMSQPLGRFVQPIFTAVPRPASPRPSPRGGTTYNTGSTWAGCTLAGKNWATVWARWTVPTAIPPPNPGSQTDWQYSAWIGLDSSNPPDNDILQSGIQQEITGSGQLFVSTASAWWEWFVHENNAPGAQPIPYRNGMNFPIGAGDTVDVLVGGSDQGGYIQFQNVTRNLYTAFAVPIPAHAQFKGDSIEWIVEQPLTQPAGANYTERLPLPDFGTITFNNCGGCSVEKVSGNPQDGTKTTITDNNGNPLTSESLGDGTVSVSYLP
jgi:hypothetical protein